MSETEHDIQATGLFFDLTKVVKNPIRMLRETNQQGEDTVSE